jgi:hypothetical protein
VPLYMVHTMNENHQDHPVSQKKLAANLKNAMRSPGPQTPEGKQRSSQNAYKHGFYSDRLFPTEELIARDLEGYTHVLAAYRSQYAPIGDLENHYVERIAAYSLRLARLLRHEQKILALGTPFEYRSMDRIVRYESNISRLLDKAISQLERLQAARKAESSHFEDSNLEADEALSNIDEATEEPQDVTTPSSVPDASPATAQQNVAPGAKQGSVPVNGQQPNKTPETPEGSAPASGSILTKAIEKVAGLPPAEKHKRNLESPEDCGTFTKSSGRFPVKPGDEKTVESVLFGDDIDDFDGPLCP